MIKYSLFVQADVGPRDVLEAGLPALGLRSSDIVVRNGALGVVRAQFEIWASRASDDGKELARKACGVEAGVEIGFWVGKLADSAVAFREMLAVSMGGGQSRVRLRDDR